jgi:hypothetical protein
MCSLGVRFTVACDINVIFSFENSRKNGRAKDKSFLKLLLERLGNGKECRLCNIAQKNYQ